VDDSEEDLGTTINTDELNIIDVDSPLPLAQTEESLSTRRARRHQFDRDKAIPSLAVLGSRSGFRSVKDGPATRKIERNFDIIGTESDPIVNFSDEAEPASEQPFPMSVPRKGLVQNRISKIEKADRARNTEETSGPRVDLRVHQGNRSIKAQMKHRVTQSSHFILKVMLMIHEI
jgi:hypothetical protein